MQGDELLEKEMARVAAGEAMQVGRCAASDGTPPF